LCPSAKAGDAASGGGGSALGDDFEASANVPAALHASLTTAQLAELARRAPDACAIADTFEALATKPFVALISGLGLLPTQCFNAIADAVDKNRSYDQDGDGNGGEMVVHVEGCRDGGDVGCGLALDRLMLHDPPYNHCGSTVAKPRRGSVQELNVEAERVASRAAYPAFERTIAGELPMRLNFQTDLSLKGASSAEFPGLLRQLSDSRSSGSVDVLCMSSLPGLKGAECMRAVVAYLIAHPHVWALNLGERSGFAFTAVDYNILCKGVESGHTGLALCWIEHQDGGLSTAATKRRFFKAVNDNRIRLQDKARAVFALTHSEEAAMRLIPWRDRDYRQRLVESTRRWTGLTLGEYTCMGQHHLKKGVDIWGVVDGKLKTVEKGTPVEEEELDESGCYVPSKDKSASSSPIESLTDLVDRLRRDLQLVSAAETVRDTVDRLRRESEAICRHRDELLLRAAPCISKPDSCALNMRGSIAGRHVTCQTAAGDFDGRVINELSGGHVRILWYDRVVDYPRETYGPWLRSKDQSSRFTIKVGDDSQAAIPDLVPFPDEDSTQLKRQRTPLLVARV